MKFSLPFFFRVFTNCITLLFIFSLVASAQKKAIYNMFLEEPVPANGTTVAFNAPVLRWPYQKGKQVTYEVQLSRDSLFNTTETLGASRLPGAMFLSYRLLEKGTWFWHYRISGKAWSATLHFKVTNTAIPMVPVAPSVFLSKVPAVHPRVLKYDPARDLTVLAKTADAKQIIAEATLDLDQKIPSDTAVKPLAPGSNEMQENKNLSDAVVALGNKVNRMVLPLCQAYLITGDKKFETKAIEIAMEVASWDPKSVSGSRDFTDSKCMSVMATVFDTFFDQLTSEQKQTLQSAIKVRAEKFYKSWLNNIESKVLSGHVWQLILNEFFNTSIALYHHEPEAAKWLSYAYALFLGRSPVLGGLDGGWAEGASYFTMNMETLIDIPERIRQYTGFDFVNTHPWYQQQADWLIYHFPPGSSADGYGDNTEELFMPPASYAAFAEVMGKLTGNPRYAWYAREMDKVQHPDLSSEQTLRWFRYAHTQNKPAPVVTDSLHLSMAHMSSEVGVASMHTHPGNTQKDLMIAMRASPFGAYGHILADQNTFNILYGGKRLFYRTGYKVAMDDPHRLGWSKHTKSQNGILINGEGQPYSAEAYGHFSRFLQGDQLAYLKGDATNAYQSAETKEDYGVTKFFRHMLLLKPGIILIYDELESSQPANWSWLIHSIKNMQVDKSANSFLSTIDNAKGMGKLWSSAVFNWTITDKFDVPAVAYRNYTGMRTKKYEDTQWHLKAVNTDKTDKIRFFSVIRVTPEGTVLPMKESMVTAGKVNISIGDWEIEANLSYTLSPQILVKSKSGKAAFAAYGGDISFQGQVYKSTLPMSSKLVESVKGKVIFTETDDQPIAPIR